MSNINGVNGKENTFVKITNKEVYLELKKVQKKLDNLDLSFTNHLSHHKKFENNIKWVVPIVVAVVTLTIQLYFNFA
jgi:hypothetical protein